MKKYFLLFSILLITLVGCSVEDSKPIEDDNRVDTVKKLLNKTQIKKYVLKYDKEIGISKAKSQVDKLIEKGHKDYVPKRGKRSNDEMDIKYEFIKEDNQHYIKVDILYIVTFTHSRFNGISHTVIHRQSEYNIGEVYIKLNVDYNENGYLLKGRSLVNEL